MSTAVTGLVIACLAWGALATLMVVQHASAAHDVAATDLKVASNAAAGSDAFGGLEVGVIVLAVIMAVGCGWGLTRRLAEYR
jgi:hypothetical protein